jgi:hypothetical protein
MLWGVTDVGIFWPELSTVQDGLRFKSFTM